MSKANQKDYVNKSFYVKFIFQFILLFVASGIISGVLLYFLTYSEMGTSYVANNNILKGTWDIILPTVTLSTVVTMVVVGLGIIYLSLYASHKLAGPLFKFERIVSEVGKGNLALWTGVRQDDQLKEFAQGMSDMVDSLKAHIQAIKSSIKALQGSLDKLPEEGRGEVEAEIKKLEKELEFFKTE